jgi:hypothetical protein
MRLLEIAQVPSEHAEEFKSGEHCLRNIFFRDLLNVSQSESSRSSTQTIFGLISKVLFQSALVYSLAN